MTPLLPRLMLASALVLASAWPAGRALAVEEPIPAETLAVATGDYAGAELMALEELEEVRGGLQIPNGMEIGFGAVVRTFVDGSLALQTRFTWTDTGPVSVVEAGALTPNLTSAAAAGGISFEDGSQLQGLVIGGDNGVTAVVHSISSDHIAHLVINNANNREIRQSTEITLDIPAFTQMQQDMAFQAMGSRLQEAASMALRDSMTP